MTEQDPLNEKPARRRPPRKAMDRSDSESSAASESSDTKKPEQESDLLAGEAVGIQSTKARKERTLVTSDQVSQPANDEEIDVTELARLKRNVQTRFVIFFLVGLVAIYFTSTLSKAVAIGSPITIMALYVLSTYKLTRLRTAKTLFADSVYYMGFLFTFVTLMFAISPEKTDIQVIINQMGVALSTTIFGMLVRVVMSHFDGIEMNVDEDVFAKLSETANKVESITDSLVKASKEQVIQISATSNQAQHTLQEMQSRLELMMSDDFLSPSRIAILQQKLNNIALTLDKFESRVESSSEALRPTVEALREASQISQEFAQWRLKVADLDALVEQLKLRTGATDLQAGTVAESVQSLKDQIELAKNQIALQMSDAENLGQHVADRLTKILQSVRAD